MISAAGTCTKARMAKALRSRKIYQHVRKCAAISHPLNLVFLEIEALIELISPIGDPSKVASRGSTCMNCALGKSSSMSERIDGSLVIISVFAWFSLALMPAQKAEHHGRHQQGYPPKVASSK